MARELKQLIVSEFERKYQNVGDTGCVVVKVGALSAQASRDARRQVRARGAEITLIKNSLFTVAAENLGLHGLGDVLDGPSAILCAENPVAAAKLARDIAAEFEALSLQGGYIDGTVLDAAGVEALAEMPSREELLATVLAQLLSPARNILGCLMAGPQNIVGCLKEIADTDGEEAA
jgi:large subunit ribosomal protein L10